MMAAGLWDEDLHLFAPDCEDMLKGEGGTLGDELCFSKVFLGFSVLSSLCPGDIHRIAVDFPPPLAALGGCSQLWLCKAACSVPREASPMAGVSDQAAGAQHVPWHRLCKSVGLSVHRAMGTEGACPARQEEGLRESEMQRTI